MMGSTDVASRPLGEQDQNLQREPKGKRKAESDAIISKRVVFRQGQHVILFLDSFINTVGLLDSCLTAMSLSQVCAERG